MRLEIVRGAVDRVICRYAYLLRTVMIRNKNEMIVQSLVLMDNFVEHENVLCSKKMKAYQRPFNQNLFINDFALEI